MSDNQITGSKFKCLKMSEYTLSVLSEKTNTRLLSESRGKRSWGLVLRAFVVSVLYYKDLHRDYGFTLDEEIKYDIHFLDLNRYIRAAESGDPEAQFDLAERYGTSNKFGVLSIAKYNMWLRKAAEQGQPNALHRLGLMYRLGVGVQVDQVVAIELYKQAIGQGHSDSLIEISKCLLNKTSVNYNPVEAGAYYLVFIHFHPKWFRNADPLGPINKHALELKEALKGEQLKASWVRAEELKEEIVNEAREKWKGSLALRIIWGSKSQLGRGI